MKIQRKDILGSLELAYDPETKDVTLVMDYIGFMQIIQTVTEKISPDDLTNNDSLGEAGLTKLVAMLYCLNNEIRDTLKARDANQAIEEAEDLIRDIQKENN